MFRQRNFYPKDPLLHVIQLKFIHKNQIHSEIVRDTVENHTHKLDSFKHGIRVHIHKQFVDSFRILTKLFASEEEVDSFQSNTFSGC